MLGITTTRLPNLSCGQKMVDLVNSPPHYTSGGIETIDYIKAKLTEEEFRGYLKGSILKYASRAGRKDDTTMDIEKMIWYANYLNKTLREST